MPAMRMNSLKSLAMNCGPLSVMMRGRGAGMGLAGALQNDFHVGFLHFLADFPVNDVSAAAVEHGAEEVKRAGDVEVADIDVPVLVGLEGLDKTGAFLGNARRLPGQQSRDFQHAIHAGRAAGGYVGVDHHEAQPSIAFQRVAPREATDALFFVVGEPVVAGHPSVVLVDLAETRFPVVELAGADADPRQHAGQRQLALLRPGADEIDDFIAGVVRDPTAGQGSPSSFFKRACSSMSSAMTSFLRCSLASRRSIFLTLASSTALALRPLSKAAWPFSKNSLSQP